MGRAVAGRRDESTASPLVPAVPAAHSQVAFQLHLLLSHALEENLSSLLHGPDEGPDTSDSASAFPEFPVGVKGAQEETLQTARLQHRHGSRWEPGGERDGVTFSTFMSGRSGTRCRHAVNKAGTVSKSTH